MSHIYQECLWFLRRSTVFIIGRIFSNNGEPLWSFICFFFFFNNLKISFTDAIENIKILEEKLIEDIIISFTWMQQTITTNVCLLQLDWSSLSIISSFYNQPWSYLVLCRNLYIIWTKFLVEISSPAKVGRNEAE